MAWEAAPVIVVILLVFLSVLWKQCVIIVRHSEGAPVPLPALRLPADRDRRRSGCAGALLQIPQNSRGAPRPSALCSRPRQPKRFAQSGINFKIPLVDEARLFSWTRVEVDESGRHSVKSINDVYIDLRESVFNFQEQQVFTKDTVLVDVDAVMYYKIVDVKKAVYEIDDLQVALCNTAQTQLKEVFGNLTFTQALQSQTSINEHLLEAFGKIFSRWGVECIRM